MNIFILEDDIIQQQHLDFIIKNMMKEKINQKYTIFASGRPTDILDHVSNAENNLYFLDIEIKNNPQSGLDLAKKIRLIDSYGLIIFVTTHSNFLPLTFEYKLMALDFIEKGQDESSFTLRIKDCLSTAIDRFNSTTPIDIFSFNNQKSNFKIPLSDILFFETTDIPHKIRLVTLNKHSEFNATLKEIENKNSNFFMCHKSYIVNLSNIYQIDKKSRIITFKDSSDYCLVSRNKLKQLLKKIANF
ncbi:LytR/AlgR family response regulator transcription factor [Dellaglioa sp. BT-FLS60]